MKLDTFTQGYIECMLWSSTDDATPSGGYPLDRNYSVSDFAAESLAAIVKDCQEFQEKNADALAEYNEHFNDSYAGHDFWLTRVGHGAGFWDRGLGELGERLTKASKAFRELDVYVGDDGKLYVS